MSEIKITTQNFDAEVIQSDIPVLVDFWATWCAPCRLIAPTIKEIAEENVGKIKVGKVNVDEEPDLAEKFGINAIPTVLGFKAGKLIGQLVGYKQKNDYLGIINK